MRKLNYTLSFLIIIFSSFASGCSAQKSSQHFSKINGTWLVELNSNDIGLAKTVFTIETNDSSFIAYTRKGAAKDILGFWKSSLARMFSKNFKGGSLLNITDGKIDKKGDTLLLRAIFRSPMGDYYFYGKIFNDSLTAKLLNATKETRGLITGIKTKVTFPLANYPQIITAAIDTTKAEIFDPAILKGENWEKFEKQINHVSPKMNDDVEMVFAWFYFARSLSISHFALVKTETQKGKQEIEKSDGSNVTLKRLSDKTAYLEIKSFGGAAGEMDSVFSIIEKKGYENLIVDLRNNPGGSIEAGMAFAKNVVDKPITAGVFLTQKWFNQHKGLPNKSQYSQFPYFTKANFNLIIKGIHNQKGLVLKVIPDSNTFNGKLFILVNGNTASTCEPLVYGLKKVKRATIVGEKTAGAMMNGEFFKLPDNFSIIVPTAIYYTSDGYKIDQSGVTPNIITPADAALNYVINNLISKN